MSDPTQYKEWKREHNNYLRRADYYVETAPLKEVRELVEKYHYARGGSNTATFRHGLYLRETDELVGAAWWIPPTKNAALSVSPEWQRVINLTRLVVKPGQPTNAASYLLGQSMKLIKQDGRFHTLLTYADSGEGHTGAIYRATNWEYVGTTKGDPRFIDPTTGRHVARKAGGKTRTRKEMEELGYVWTPPTPKHKFKKHLT